MPRPPRKTEQPTRKALIEAAEQLFARRGFDKVSVAEIAEKASAYPNQVTHHFGGKEALFVESACQSMLRTAKDAERVSRHSESIDQHARMLIARLLGPGAESVMFFAEAMLMARRKPELSEVIRETLDRLQTAGETAMVATLMRTGWETRVMPDVITRGFWSSVFGLALEKAATGRDFDHSSSEAVALLMMNLNKAFTTSSETEKFHET
ncbi:TetR family transcriptional regulator [Rhodococcus erythropolis]|uniref:TetR/AcrR family transcriptional regulator C-terminal domain-containing protein n=1 Tax=Rhodococcus erythropolis TaxID=1833 RepID=UPI00210917D1|nr:TetR/AcrR family transcriptional regulator C-terminal domain-containing protein [Rhodococcus erythropolis]MCQ4129184.1 TetR family transcriptional regulator [Rhodococcus erythropolis]